MIKLGGGTLIGGNGNFNPLITDGPFCGHLSHGAVQPEPAETTVGDYPFGDDALGESALRYRHRKRIKHISTRAWSTHDDELG